MEVSINIRVVRKLFDHGYIVEPINGADFNTALLLLSSKNFDDSFLISKELINAEIGGKFSLLQKENRYQLFLNSLTFFSIESGRNPNSVLSKTEAQENKSEVQENKPKNKNRYLGQPGQINVGDQSVYKKKSVSITHIGKPFILNKKLVDIPDWLYQKMKDQQVCWIYFDYIEEGNTSSNQHIAVEPPSIPLKQAIYECVEYFKRHGEKTRQKTLIHSEAPGNVNLQRYCDLIHIDPEMKVFFIESENYLWLLEQNRSDPLPNVKLNNINYGGWILAKASHSIILEKLTTLDITLKKSPNLYQ